MRVNFPSNIVNFAIIVNICTAIFSVSLVLKTGKAVVEMIFNYFWKISIHVNASRLGVGIIEEERMKGCRLMTLNPAEQ